MICSMPPFLFISCEDLVDLPRITDLKKSFPAPEMSDMSQAFEVDNILSCEKDITD